MVWHSEPFSRVKFSPCEFKSLKILFGSEKKKDRVLSLVWVPKSKIMALGGAANCFNHKLGCLNYCPCSQARVVFLVNIKTEKPRVGGSSSPFFPFLHFFYLWWFLIPCKTVEGILFFFSFLPYSFLVRERNWGDMTEILHEGALENYDWDSDVNGAGWFFTLCLKLH